MSFVLLRRSHGFPWSYPAPHPGRFLPGPLRGAKAGLTGQSLFQPTQQHQSRIPVPATGNATMRTRMLPVRERFSLFRQLPARMAALAWHDLPRWRFLVPRPSLFRLGPGHLEECRRGSGQHFPESWLRLFEQRNPIFRWMACRAHTVRSTVGSIPLNLSRPEFFRPGWNAA